jgi:hypothetical protein
MQGVASKMAAGGKPTARSVDKADGQETRDDSQDGQEFTRGDLVDHKKFGRGVVTGTLIGRPPVIPVNQAGAAGFFSYMGLAGE